ncbi:MAG: molecular chaperone TorD family protein [Pseudomonadota bacterium]
MGAEERLRAEFYEFLASLLARPPSPETLRGLTTLEGDETDLGKAVKTLARVASRVTPEAAEREFHDLFIGLGRGELLPYASVYMTGFLNEKPLAKLRDDMSRLRISRADDVFEPEDNAASLFDMMAGLIRGRFTGQPAPLAEQQAFFAAHMGSWMAHFFADLEGAKRSVLYAPVGAVGKAFIEIEREAFRMEGAAS